MSARGNALDIVDVINALFFQDFKDFLFVLGVVFDHNGHFRTAGEVDTQTEARCRVGFRAGHRKHDDEHANDKRGSDAPERKFFGNFQIKEFLL